MLSDNLQEFYHGYHGTPYLYILIGDRVWYFDKDTITKSSYPYAPRQLSESLFNWVFR